MPARFYAPNLETSGDLMSMPTEEAEHLTRVLRLSAGAAIRLFDGRGHEFDAVVQEITHGIVRVRIGQAVATAPEPRLAVTLAQAILKGDKMDDIVRDVVMMGVATIRPMITARTEAPIAGFDRGRRRERWERIAVASAKQCGRAVVPPIAERKTFDQITREIEGLQLPSPALMLVEPGAGGGAIPLRDLAGEPPVAVTILIGPEGGWTPQEVEAGARGCRLVSLGGLTLRADAAAVIALAALFTRWRVF